jgi:hypothetical protein
MSPTDIQLPAAAHVTHGTNSSGLGGGLGSRESKNLNLPVKAAYVHVADTPASFVWLGTFNGKLGGQC